MRNTNWFVWLIILGVGWTVAGMIASVLVTQLGFPYTWIGPLTLVMLGVVLFLVYRGYPWQAWGLAACVGFILIAALAILRGLTAAEPDIPEAYRAEFEAADSYNSLLGMDWLLHEDVLGDAFIEYDPDRVTYLVSPGTYDTFPLLTVEFAPIETAGGQWVFVSGTVQMDRTYAADPLNNWISAANATFDPDRAVREVQPTLTVSYPVRSLSTRPLNALATLTITYPDGSGEIVESTLTRQFAVQSPGQDIYNAYERYFNWQRSRSIVTTPMWIVLVFGSVLAGAGSAYFVREGALVAQPSSGLQVVVRRLSGSQKLGADVHPLDKFRDETDAERGVFVGRVVAQSPAGRGGLRTGDVLLSLDGKPTNSPAAVDRIGKSRKRGDVLTARILRHGEEIDLTIRY